MNFLEQEKGLSPGVSIEIDSIVVGDAMDCVGCGFPLCGGIRQRNWAGDQSGWSSRNAVGCVQFYPVARSFVVMAIGDACDMGFGKVCSRPLNPKNIHFPYWRRRENAENTNFSFRVRTLGRDPDGEIEVPKSQQTIAPPARSGKRSRSEGRMGWERKHRISEKRYAFVFPVP